jgi:hypothetical protein
MFLSFSLSAVALASGCPLIEPCDGKECSMARHASKQIAELIRTEYVELPGLKLTFWQTQRLWNLPEDVCRQALTMLTQARFLTRAADGAYVRTAVSVPRPDPVQEPLQ